MVPTVVGPLTLIGLFVAKLKAATLVAGVLFPVGTAPPVQLPAVFQSFAAVPPAQTLPAVSST